jgi:gamma-glutamylputrescine oxidase
MQLDKVFPQLKSLKVDYIWGGYIAITVNRVPDIGMLNDRVFYAHGFSGHGVAFTGIAGKILAESMASEKTTELEAFEKIKHRKFPGGRIFRMPLLVTISAMQRMMDIFNA